MMRIMMIMYGVDETDENDDNDEKDNYIWSSIINQYQWTQYDV